MLWTAKLNYINHLQATKGKSCLAEIQFVFYNVTSGTTAYGYAILLAG